MTGASCASCVHHMHTLTCLTSGACVSAGCHVALLHACRGYAAEVPPMLVLRDGAAVHSSAGTARCLRSA